MAQERFVVIGAGPAGVRACETLVKAGIRPVLLDESDRSGGQIYRRQPEGFTRSYAKLYGSESDKAHRVHDSFEQIGGDIDYRPSTLVWNLGDGQAYCHDGASAFTVSYDAVIIASGATDRVFPLPGWTLPGIYTLGASQIALKSQACAIGENPVFVGTGPLLYLVAYQYLKAGAKPLAVLDTSNFANMLAGLSRMAMRPRVLFQGFGYMAALKRAGVRVKSGITPLGFRGSNVLEAIEYQTGSGQKRTIACDGVGYGFHLRAETQLADLAGVPFAYNETLGQWLPESDPDGRTSRQGVYLAGDGFQLAGADGAELSGRLAAFAALKDAGHRVDALEIEQMRAKNRTMIAFRDGLAQAFPWPGARLANALPDDALVCRCEAISAGTLRETVTGKGAPEVNRAKALSRVGMGRCQGRYCGLASAAIVADAQGIAIKDAGRLRGQAPVKPLPTNLRLDND